MNIQDQVSALVTIIAATEGVMQDDLKISDIAVRCNGSDDETVMSIIENDDM